MGLTVNDNPKPTKVSMSNNQQKHDELRMNLGKDYARAEADFLEIRKVFHSTYHQLTSADEELLLLIKIRIMDDYVNGGFKWYLTQQ